MLRGRRGKAPAWKRHAPLAIYVLVVLLSWAALFKLLSKTQGMLEEEEDMHDETIDVEALEEAEEEVGAQQEVVEELEAELAKPFPEIKVSGPSSTSTLALGDILLQNEVKPMLETFEQGAHAPVGARGRPRGQGPPPSADARGKLVSALSHIVSVLGSGVDTVNALEVPKLDVGEWNHEYVLAMCTIPRQGQDYLTPTIEALAAAMPQDEAHPMYGKFLVLVLNQVPGQHAVFDQLRAKHHGTHIQFVENTKRWLDPFADRLPPVDDRNNPIDRPGPRVRQQNCDLVSLMKTAAGHAKYFVFFEDDFVLCKGGLPAIDYVVQKANARDPEWSAIRTSFGMQGIIFKDDHLLHFAAYVASQLARKPPDHLVVEWFVNSRPESRAYLAKGRHNYSFKYNLYEHIGGQSSLREMRSARTPPCWASYDSRLWAGVDAFDRKRCPHDDLWPCKADSPPTARDAATAQLHHTLLAASARNGGSNVRIMTQQPLEWTPWARQ